MQRVMEHEGEAGEQKGKRSEEANVERERKGDGQGRKS